MNRRLKIKKRLAESKNPLEYVFPNEDIKRAMLRSHAALVVARAAVLKAEAVSRNVESIQQCFDAAQEAAAAVHIAKEAMEEAELRVNLWGK